MVSFPWNNAENWEKYDPKLRETADQPIQLPHTQALADSIHLQPPGILLLRGPRQIGKSTLLRQFAARCLAQGIHPSSLALCDAERAENRHHLLGEMETFLRSQQEFSVLLVDELTSVPEWWLSVKALADQGLLNNALLLGTGSSAEEMAKGADLMPGRRGRRHPVDLELLPVPFRSISHRLNFLEYLLTGGQPWAINEYLRLGHIPAHVYELQYAALAGAFHKSRHQSQNLPYLLHYLADRQSTPGSITKLARDCGLGSNRTGEDYVALLERIFAVIVCPWSSPAGGPNAPRKNRKFYAADPFLFHLFSEAGKGWDAAFAFSKTRLENPALLGRLVEGVVAAELRRRQGFSGLSYWAGAKEIDFIGTPCIEVKYQNYVSVEEFTWAEKVLPKHVELLVLTKKDRAVKGRIRLLPLEEWLLNSNKSS